MSAAGARRGAALALLVAAGALAFQHWRLRDPHVRYHRFDLPAFDAYPYVAMAEHPQFFTVAPWGYRVLTPWLVHAAPVHGVVRGFRLVNGAALAAAGILLWLFLRRLGLGPWAALGGLALFVLSPPVAELVRNPFLTDALTVALATALLLALEAGAGLSVLLPLAILGALAKESFLVLLPVVYFARRERDGDRRALGLAVAATLAALAVTGVLRWWWTPHLQTPLPDLQPATLAAGWANLRAFLDRQRWGAPFLAVSVVATLLAARREAGRRVLRRYGYVLLAAVAAPFFNPVVFSSGDVRRLLVYALPALIPVVLMAVLPARPPAEERPGAGSPARAGLRAAGGLVAVASVVLPLVVVDRYRRADLQGRRDGPLVLAFCRDSLRTARRLQRGEPVVFDPANRNFQWGVSDPGQLEKMRWFLREGWGELPHYGTGDVMMRAPRASLVLPCLDPRDLALTLELAAGGGSGGAEAGGTVLVNGRPLGDWRVPAPAPQAWRVPATALVRGDNTVTLVVAAGDPGAVRFVRLVAAPASP